MLNSSEDTLRQKIMVILTIIIALFIVEILNLAFGRSLNYFGIIPRHLFGLGGIIFSPFLHASPSHLISNVIGFTIFGAFVISYGIRKFYKITWFIMVAGGLFTWLLGVRGIHIGASIVIFGYMGYAVALFGAFRESRAGIFSLFILITFVLKITSGAPFDPTVSHMGHFFGFASGVAYVIIFELKDRLILALEAIGEQDENTDL